MYAPVKILGMVGKLYEVVNQGVIRLLLTFVTVYYYPN